MYCPECGEEVKEVKIVGEYVRTAVVNNKGEIIKYKDDLRVLDDSIVIIECLFCTADLAEYIKELR